MEPRKATLAERWNDARPTKTIVGWACAASIVGTMIVGFTWGGWVTAGTAEKMGVAVSEEAVAKRLAPLCVGRFNDDPKKAGKLKEFREVSNSWEKTDYIKKQGWATMPGEQEPVSSVAEECGKLLMKISPA
jgi:hypothetical protein